MHFDICADCKIGSVSMVLKTNINTLYWVLIQACAPPMHTILHIANTILRYIQTPPHPATCTCWWNTAKVGGGGITEQVTSHVCSIWDRFCDLRPHCPRLLSNIIRGMFYSTSIIRDGIMLVQQHITFFLFLIK